MTGAREPLATMVTPALLVDWPTVERNVAAMAARARDAGVAMRPHAKTHKSGDVARLQRAAGAEGLTVATPAEAEWFAADGVPAITIARPVADRGAIDRVVALADRVALRLVADSAEVVRAVDAAAAQAGTSLDLLWEVECGTMRCGTAPGDETAALLAELVPELRALRLAGVMTFGGHAYAASSLAGVDAAAADELDAVRTTAQALAARGLRPSVLSVGTTPTSHRIEAASGATEIRPGNYVFHDMSQVDLGVATLEDCAVTVLATVVARPAADRVIVDAGAKALSNERMGPGTGLGRVLGHPRLAVTKLYEEHGILVGPDAASVRIGDRLRIVPTHACTTVNLYASGVRVDGDEVVGTHPVDVRGWAPQPAAA